MSRSRPRGFTALKLLGRTNGPRGPFHVRAAMSWIGEIVKAELG
jgi:hypothetical protein